MRDGLAFIPYFGRTPAPGIAAGEFHDPVMTYVLTGVLPAPETYERLAKGSLYALLCS